MELVTRVYDNKSADSLKILPNENPTDEEVYAIFKKLADLTLASIREGGDFRRANRDRDWSRYAAHVRVQRVHSPEDQAVLVTRAEKRVAKEAKRNAANAKWRIEDAVRQYKKVCERLGITPDARVAIDTSHLAELGYSRKAW